MAKSSYRPERPVTSEKISKLLNEKLGKTGKRGDSFVQWKRRFKRRLPESRGWVRGYFGAQYGGAFRYMAAIAISSDDDLKLESCYVVDGSYTSMDEAERAADEECKKLGVLEVMFKDD